MTLGFAINSTATPIYGVQNFTLTGSDSNYTTSFVAPSTTTYYAAIDNNNNTTALNINITDTIVTTSSPRTITYNLNSTTEYAVMVMGWASKLSFITNASTKLALSGYIDLMWGSTYEQGTSEHHRCS